MAVEAGDTKMKREYFWSSVIIGSSVLILLALVGNARLWGGMASIEMAPSSPPDTFYFQLELAGQTVGDYSECFGLGSTNAISEDIVPTDGGVLVEQKTPGVLEWSNIILKRNTPSDMVVVAWRTTVESGHVTEAVRDGAILMFLAGSAEPLARWKFHNGWPASLSFEGAKEELTIVHAGLERVDLRNAPLQGRPR
jgi:phage tail-like protein